MFLHQSFFNDPNDILKFIKVKKTLLDCTFGQGNMSLPFIYKQYNVFACDIDNFSYTNYLENYQNFENLHFYKGWFQSFIKTNLFNESDIDTAVIDLGLNDKQISEDFGYKSKYLRFHLTNKKLKMNNYINLCTPKNLSKILIRFGGHKYPSIVKKIMKKRPFFNNKEISDCLNYSENAFLSYTLFNFTNRYLENVIEGIIYMFTIKPNIEIYVFTFCNIEVTTIKQMKFYFSVKIEEIELTNNIKTFSRLFKIKWNY